MGDRVGHPARDDGRYPASMPCSVTLPAMTMRRLSDELLRKWVCGSPTSNTLCSMLKWQVGDACVRGTSSFDERTVT